MLTVIETLFVPARQWKTMNKETFVVHQPHTKLDSDNHSLIAPLYQSVKYYFDSYQAVEDLLNQKREGFLYSRVLNPTVRQLEVTLSKLQNTEDGICLASGVAAITGTLLSLLSSGDHVVGFYDGYRPTRIFLRETLKRFGINCSLAWGEDLNSLTNAIIPGKTKALIFESPTNPTTKITDVASVVKLCKKAGVLTILDNTFAGFHNHSDFDIDIYLHSLTKFAVGSGDAMGGAILSRKELIDHIRHETMEMGAVLDPRAADFCLRGMRTYFLRYDRQCENALNVAEFLESNPNTERTLYPGLSSHPNHDLAKKQMKDFGAVISIDIKGGKAQMEKFLNKLKLFKLAGSLGSQDSLVAPSELFYGDDLSEQEKKKAFITESTVRLSIGTEHPQDLIEDLTQALTTP